MAEPDQPEPAVRRRADDRQSLTQRGKAIGYVPACDPGNVRSDQKSWTGSCAQSPRPTNTQISAALRDPLHICGPDAAGHSLSVRRDSQQEVPTWVAEPPEQRAGLMPEPPCSVRHANLAAKTGLYPARTWLFDHDDQGRTSHKVRTISRCGMPASMNSGPTISNPSSA